MNCWLKNFAPIDTVEILRQRLHVGAPERGDGKSSCAQHRTSRLERRLLHSVSATEPRGRIHREKYGDVVTRTHFLICNTRESQREEIVCAGL